MNQKGKAFLFVFGVLAVLVGVLFIPVLLRLDIGGVQPSEEQHGEGNMVPRELAGLELQHEMSGEEAIQDISKLHGTDIEVVNGYIAQYGDAAKEAVLWIAQARDENDAKGLLQAMDVKIPQSKVFGNRRVEEKNGGTYYYVDGAGMRNYYWQQGNLVVWIGVKDTSADMEAVLAATVKALKQEH